MKLTTRDEILTAARRVLDMRNALTGSTPLTIEQQRELAEVAYQALLRLTPLAEAAAPIAADDREVPIWLKRMQAESENDHD